MPRSSLIAGEVRRLLQAQIPFRYRLVHGLRPEIAADADVWAMIAGRSAITQIERHLAIPTPDLDPDDEAATAMLSGATEALLFWVTQARRQAATWAESLVLELRDALWTDGHRMDPRWDVGRTMQQVLRLAGHLQPAELLHPGDRVRVCRTLAATRLNDQPDDRALLLRVLREPDDHGHVLAIASGGRAEVALASGVSAYLAREALWPEGDPELAALRHRVVAASEEMYASSATWSAPDSGDEAFWEAERARLCAHADLWSPASSKRRVAEPIRREVRA